MHCVVSIIFFSLSSTDFLQAFYVLYSVDCIILVIRFIVFFELYFMHCVLYIIFFLLLSMHCLQCILLIVLYSICCSICCIIFIGHICLCILCICIICICILCNCMLCICILCICFHLFLYAFVGSGGSREPYKSLGPFFCCSALLCSPRL